MPSARTRSDCSLLLVASIAALLVGVACSSVTGGTKSPTSSSAGPSALAGGKQIGAIVVSLSEELPGASIAYGALAA